MNLPPGGPQRRPLIAQRQMDLLDFVEEDLPALRPQRQHYMDMDLQEALPQRRAVIDLDVDDEIENFMDGLSDSEDDDPWADEWEDPNQNYMAQLPGNNFPPAQVVPPLQQNLREPPLVLERHDSGHEAQESSPKDVKAECFTQVYSVFPDICAVHLEEIYTQHGGAAERMLAAICENMENGKPYPKKQKVTHGVKRKRELTASEEAQKTFGAPDREDDATKVYFNVARKILGYEFRSTPQNYIDNILRTRATRHLFQAYKALEEAERTYAGADPKPYRALKKAREGSRLYNSDGLENTISALEQDRHEQDHLKAARELLVARRVRQEDGDRRAAEKLDEEEERLNEIAALRDGTMKECGCCFDNVPMNRMVHCNTEDWHWFCRACAKQTAENVIGNQKYEITCMSMDGCDANFSRSQLQEFLQENSLIALDRNEQEAVLRMAGIENLASCPFCPYAAEYPPVEEDKEFRCEAEDCQKVSCRLCKLETHIPKSCAENARENAPSIRRQIEEAMSEALIRKCNKCRTPFVKDFGCNKMTCMASGCRNVQCYVCSMSCAYDHFDDSHRGGKPGNCKLFDNVEERHEEEVKKAEDEAIKKVLLDNPEYTEEELRVHVSDNVKRDDEQRKARNPHVPPVVHRAFPGAPPGVVPGGAAAIGGALAAAAAVRQNALELRIAQQERQFLERRRLEAVMDDLEPDPEELMWANMFGLAMPPDDPNWDDRVFANMWMPDPAYAPPAPPARQAQPAQPAQRAQPAQPAQRAQRAQLPRLMVPPLPNAGDMGMFGQGHNNLMHMRHAAALRGEGAVFRARLEELAQNRNAPANPQPAVQKPALQLHSRLHQAVAQRGRNLNGPANPQPAVQARLEALVQRERNRYAPANPQPAVQQPVEQKPAVQVRLEALAQRRRNLHAPANPQPAVQQPVVQQPAPQQPAPQQPEQQHIPGRHRDPRPHLHALLGQEAGRGRIYNFAAQMANRVGLGYAPNPAIAAAAPAAPPPAPLMFGRPRYFPNLAQPAWPGPEPQLPNMNVGGMRVDEQIPSPDHTPKRRFSRLD